MKIQSTLGLCLSVALLLGGAAAHADKGKSKPKNARAMQVQLDKNGKKLSAPDDSNLSSKTASADSIVDAKGMMPSKSEPARYHADGSISARLGTESLEYLVMTVDNKGNKELSHQKADELDLETTNSNQGEK